MDKTNFQKLYYRLLSEELKYIYTQIELSPKDQVIFEDNLRAGEYGLALEVILDSEVDIPNEASAQIEILRSVMNINR